MIKNRCTSVNTFRYKNQCTRLPVSYCFPSAINASLSKILANTATYPLETIRLLTLSKNEQKNVNLFVGYGTYLPYCIFSNIITYHTLYVCLSLISIVNYDLKLLFASCITAFATSFYKIPYSYFLKNRIIGVNVSLSKLYIPSYYIKAFAATVCEDIPELFIKIFCSNCVKIYFPFLSVIHSSMLIAIVTSLILCPVEFWKTSILCNTKKMRLSVKTVAIRLIISLVNLFVFFYSFNIFNTQSFNMI